MLALLSAALLALAPGPALVSSLGRPLPRIASLPGGPRATQLAWIASLRGGQAEMSLLSAVGAAYEAQLRAQPVLTQSLTAAVTFALSDATAQVIDADEKGPDWKRTLVTAAVGLFYFGPALFYFLEFVTWLVPGAGLRSTLLKTLVGQLGFGPAGTSVFFGAFLIKDYGLVSGLRQLPAKIRQDLLVTWASELCYWPFVDIICYSFVPVRWIPLASNVANFLWTIYLSLQAARKVETPPLSGGIAPQYEA